MSDPDDDLRAVLRDFYLRTDPIPAGARAMAHGAFAWRDVDRELAEILADSLLVDAAVRSHGGPRLITFTTATHTIEIEVNETGRTRQIVGQLIPAEPGELEVRTAPQRPAVRPDELGRFFLADLSAGPFSLSWCPTEGQGVNTAWIDI